MAGEGTPPAAPALHDHGSGAAGNRQFHELLAAWMRGTLALGGLTLAAGYPAAAMADAACFASDPEKAFQVAQLYDSGLFVRQDFALAAACYRVAAQAGNRAAQFNIGAMYDNGRGVPRDVVTAAKWYRRAAEQGDGRGAYALGLIYQEGSALPADRQEALKWFRMAERDGIAAATAKIAALTGRAAAPLTAARKQGLEEYRRGFAFLTGEGEKQDDAAAFQWFSRGAYAGGDLAAYALADLYERGEGVARDEMMASAWYGVAAREAPAGSKLHDAAAHDAARLAARLTVDERAAAEKQTRDILAAVARERAGAATSSGSSGR